MNNPLLIRADGGLRSGTGHIMRCLALAQAWQDSGSDAAFVLHSKLPAIEEKLLSENFIVTHLDVDPGSNHDAFATAGIAEDLDACWIAVDGYCFDSNYQKVLKDKTPRVLFIDDNKHCGHYFSQIILNQNIYADESLYVNREQDTQLLLGSNYALLRRDFANIFSNNRHISGEANKILITMGGSDPDNVTLKALKALEMAKICDLEICAVVGSTNPNIDSLNDFIANSDLNISLIQNANDMPSLMNWADLAITAGGTTCLELAYMGTPAIIVVTANNQANAAENFESAEFAINLGWHESVLPEDITQVLLKAIYDPDLRKHMSLSGQKLVDGLGARRVVHRMVNYDSEGTINDEHNH